MIPRLTGDHHHKFNNVGDVATDDASAGYVLTIVVPGEAPIWAPPDAGLPDGGTEGQALLKDSSADGDASWHNVEDIATAETDATLVLAPDGAGGVEFRAETGGGGSTGRFYIPFGSGDEVYAP